MAEISVLRTSSNYEREEMAENQIKQRNEKLRIFDLTKYIYDEDRDEQGI
jgi:hypothetical protein